MFRVIKQLEMFRKDTSGIGQNDQKLEIWGWMVEENVEQVVMSENS
jgi:hypothetical protein